MEASSSTAATAIGYVMSGQYSSFEGHGVGLGLCSIQKLAKLQQNSVFADGKLMVTVCNTKAHKGHLAVLTLTT